MMNFIIKQHSTLPLLTFPISEKLIERINITKDMLENVGVTFSMYDVENDEYVILNKKAKIWYRDDIYEYSDDNDYVLVYEFTKNDTAKYGIFNCEFKLSFLNPYCKIITLPNDGYIRVNIQPSKTKVNLIN